MTKRSHDLLRDLLDELCVTPIYTAACSRCGISTKTLWRYIRASQREHDPVRYRFVWSEVEDWFHNHLKHAMRMSALMIEAAARHHALHGFDEVQVFQGKMCWKEDAKLAGLSDADLARLGRADRYERNPDGSLIPLTVRRKPSDQLVLKMLAAHFPRTYGEKVEHQHNGIIAVMRIGRDGTMRPNTPLPKPEDQSDGLVESADSRVADLKQMKIGMVVTEPCKTSAELEECEARMRSSPIAVEFVDADGSVECVTEDGGSAPEQAPSEEPAHGAPEVPAKDVRPLRFHPRPRGYRIV
jgi:hypothetical protein